MHGASSSIAATAHWLNRYDKRLNVSCAVGSCGSCYGDKCLCHLALLPGPPVLSEGVRIFLGSGTNTAGRGVALAPAGCVDGAAARIPVR